MASNIKWTFQIFEVVEYIKFWMAESHSEATETHLQDLSLDSLHQLDVLGH